MSPQGALVLTLTALPVLFAVVFAALGAVLWHGTHRLNRFVFVFTLGLGGFCAYTLTVVAANRLHIVNLPQIQLVIWKGEIWTGPKSEVAPEVPVKSGFSHPAPTPAPVIKHIVLDPNVEGTVTKVRILDEKP